MTEGCRFCLANTLLFDSPVAETEHFYILRNIDTRFEHGAIVVPRRHSTSPFEMDATEWQDFPNALAAARALFAELEPAGFTLGWNVGQTVFHTHLHLIARFAGDVHEGNGIRRIFKTSDED